MLYSISVNPNCSSIVSKGFSLLNADPDRAYILFYSVLNNLPWYDRDSQKSCIGIARVYQIKNQHHQAVTIYLNIMEQQDYLNCPHISATTHLSLGRCFHEQKQYRNAEQALKEGLDLSYISKRKRLLLKLALIAVLADQEKHEQALIHSGELYNQYPDNINCLLTHTRCLRNSGDILKSISYLETKLAKGCSDSRIYSALIVTYARSTVKLKTGEETVTQALKKFPNERKILRTAARYYQSSKNFEKAFKLIKKALTLNPYDSKTLVVYANAAITAEKEYNSAILAIEQYLQHYSNQDLTSYINTLYILRNKPTNNVIAEEPCSLEKIK